MNHGILEFRNLPVFELADQLIQRFDLYQYTGQAPFLQAFQDILLQYTRRESTDIRSFLNWWEVEKEKKCVAMPDNQDAIRLMTIHKSKGLEFDAVIIPFCDWSLCKSGKTLWCRPDEKPFSDMKLLPLKFEQALRDTIFMKEYLHEKMMSYIDNLNLLYVAFTRTKKLLFISTPQPKKDSFSNVKDLIHRVSETMSFKLGVLCEKVSKKEETPPEYLTRPTLRSLDFVPHIVRNSDWFTVGGRSAQVDKGKLMHEIFRNIVTIADLERCLNAMIVEGRLPEAERAHFVDMVRRSLDNSIVRHWFSPGVEVKTEAEILLPDGSIARPDRIVFFNGQVQVIDYKFGARQPEEHKQQVQHYINYLREMGYTSVTGFLWYVTLNEVRVCQ